MYLCIEFYSQNNFSKFWSYCSIDLALSLHGEKSDAILIHILLYKPVFRVFFFYLIDLFEIIMPFFPALVDDYSSLWFYLPWMSLSSSPSAFISLAFYERKDQFISLIDPKESESLIGHFMSFFLRALGQAL